MIGYLVMSALTLSFLALVWRRDTFINIFIKLDLVVLAVWGWIMVLLEMGYVVKS